MRSAEDEPEMPPEQAGQDDLARLRRDNDSILRSAGEGIYGLCDKGLTTFVNPAAASMLGWELEELVGRPQHEIIHHSRSDGSSYPACECPIYAAFSDGAVHRVDDEVFWRKDGTPIPVEYVSTPVLDEAGKITGAVVTFNDISERKRREAELRNALSEVQRLKDRLHAENRYLQDEIKVDHDFQSLVGESEELRRAKRRVEQVAGTDATVLVLGETGVGKEVFARAIHDLSTRSERALVKVNCAALPTTLIESELFGHEKGAFTGATTRRIGRFELADKGTIFLDEIGELPLELQAKLLRVLQEGEFERLGGHDSIQVDVRIVAATNRDLAKMVCDGDFRDDLFYRLNVFPVAIPPLRDRKSDIPALVSFFVDKLSRKLGKKIDSVPQSSQLALANYAWPGNVRELENILERAVILTSDATLRVDEALDVPAVSPDAGPKREDRAGKRGRSLESVEREHIQSVLEDSNWRISGEGGAAQILGLHANTLRSRMQKLGIRRP